MTPKNIRKLLGDEMAQHDKQFLRYAVDRSDLIEYLQDEDNKFVIINAARGSGKSGLLISHGEDLRSTNSVERIIIKKYYANVNRPQGTPDVNSYGNFWKNTILGWVVSAIGASKHLAITDDEIAAVEIAEQSGSKQLNIISSILKRLKFSGLPVEKLNYDPHVSDEMVGRLLEEANLSFWILLDEMDENYGNVEGANNEMVGLLQACNYCSHQFKDIYIRVTIRPHILTILNKTYDAVQKFRQHELSIDWNADELRTILAKRISFFNAGDSKQTHLSLSADSSEKPIEVRESDLIGKYISDFDMKFKDGYPTRYRALHTVSLGRPRWMLEFCALALAQDPLSEFASINDIKKAMYEYGTNRVQFLSGEHRFHCPYLEKAINKIAGIRKAALGSTSQLCAMIRDEIIKPGIVSVEEERSRADVALEIASVLHMVEFIRAKQDLGGGGDDHRFYSFADRPSLLTSVSHDRTISWEVHPVFARGLNIIDSNAYRVGPDIRLLGERRRSNFPRDGSSSF